MPTVIPLLSLSSLCLLPLNHSAPLSTRSSPQYLPPLSAVVVIVAVPALLLLFGTKLHARLVDCCLEGLHPCPAPSTRSSLPPSRQLSLSFSWSAVDCCFRPPPCPRWPNLHPPSQLSSSCRHPCCGRATTAEVVAAQLWQRSDGSTSRAEKVAAQQWRWQRSNGNGGAAMAMAAQRLQRRRSDCDGGAATA